MLLRDNSDAVHVEFLKIHADATSNTANQTLEDESLLVRAQISQDMANPVSAIQFWTDKPLRKRCIFGWLTFAAGQGTATLVINSKFVVPSCPNLYDSLTHFLL